MQLAAANSLDRFIGWLPQLLACLLLLAVPGLGQASPPGWRVAEEEEEHSSRDSTESAACVAADGLRLRGRVASPGHPPRAAWLHAASTASAGAIQSPPSALRLGAGSLNGCGAFLRC